MMMRGAHIISPGGAIRRNGGATIRGMKLRGAQISLLGGAIVRNGGAIRMKRN
jgi:hypothetical protein